MNTPRISGGACVNLSTPNRTLSEFNYQAIVRTSDPEVANYILRKIEVDAVDVSNVLNALTTSNAASNAVLESLNYLNTTLSGVLSLLHQNPLSGISNADTSAALTALTAVSNPLNAAIAHLNTASSAALGTAPDLLKAALDASDAFNATLNATLGHLAAAVNAALSASASALMSALAASNVALTAAINAANSALKVVLNASSAVDTVDVATRYELVGGAQTIERKPIALDNPVSWQDAPDDKKKKNLSIYQAVTIATGHILHYKSLFKADGYSLGDLIYSLPLAPGQKKQIVTFDASHTLQGAESQALSQSERLVAGIASERDITNQLGGNITERMRGSSSANTSGISAGFGTGGSGSGSGSGGTSAFGGSGSAVLGVAGGAANANSDASSDSSRDISQFFGEKLRQSIMQNAASYRQQNASVVTTVQEGQRYGVISEVVANHNHCHALTMMYFEVLRHYAIFQELSGVEECVFVPLLMTNFTTQNIYKWRDVLAQFLLPMPSETYLQPFSFTAGSGRQHPLLKAFDANERIKTQYANVDFPQGSYDDEQIRFIKGEMRLRVELPRPKTRYDRIMSLPITTKGIDPAEMAAAGVDYATNMALYAAKTALTAGFLALFEQPPPAPGMKKTIKEEVLEREKIFDSFMTLDANYQSVPPAQCIRVTNFSPPAPIAVAWSNGSITFKGGSVENFFADNIDDQTQWQAYADILGYPSVLKMLDAYFTGNLISEWDTIFYNQMAPAIFEKIIARIKIDPITVDFSSETKYKGGERLIRLNLNGTVSKKRNDAQLDKLKMSVDNPKIEPLRPYVTLAVEDMTILYSTSHYNGVLFSGGVKDDLLNGTTLYTPMNSEEQRNPKKEDAYLVYKLIEHLNSNLEHYNKVLWYNLDPDRRFMLLDGFHIQIYDEAGALIPRDRRGLRSLASVVKNDLITVTGNSLVFPVAAGYKVSNDYIIEKTEIRAGTDDEQKKKRVTLLDHYQPLTPIKPYRISVPSRGVFAEAIQGACNACEKIETDRLQDWNKFPNTDEPTAISPVTPPTVGITDWRAAFKDFATPMINIQNAPADPTPGAGLAGLSALLGQSGVFKDITGLEGNQKNVLQTYLSNQENAKAFGQMAKEMAMQSHNTQNSGKIMDTLKGAKSDGALNQEEYSKLVKDHVQQQIDGGKTKQAELEMEKQANPSPLTKAAIDAAGQGKDVKAQKIDNEGNSESVDIETIAPSGSTGLGGGPGGILGTIADLVKGQAPGVTRSPLVPFDPLGTSSQAQAAWAKMVAASPSEHQARLDDYIARFGFDTTARPEVIRGEGIREPAQGILPADIEAVLAVATVLGTAPQNVLSVWISEGKLVHDRMLRGGTESQSVDSTLLATVDDAHKRAFARSLVFFRAFGSDAFSAMIPHGAPGGDNLPLGVDANHDAAFNNKLVVMRTAGVGGMSGKTDREIRDYFTLVGGGLRVVGHVAGLEFGLRNDSVASWLWLQAGLFEVYRRDTEQQLATLYGSAIDLSDRPWVTYLRWNGGPAAVTQFLNNFANAEDAINHRFGMAPDRIPTSQLDRYYGRGSGGGQSAAALANSILVQYLVETTRIWFS